MKSVFLAFVLTVLFVSLIITGVLILQSFLRNTIVSEYRHLKRISPLLRVGRVRFLLLGVVIVIALLCLGASKLLTGKPILGITGGIIFPYLLRRVCRIWEESQSKANDEAALNLLVGVRGLVAVGISLPSALFQVSQHLDGDFSYYFSKHLNRFDSGKSLCDILNQFRQRSCLKVSSMAFRMLEIAHAKGLQARPILENLIPFLEKEMSVKKRIIGMRNSVIAQCGVAALLPWFLGGTLHFFEPTLVEHFLQHAVCNLVIGLALIFQILGIWVVWNLSKFYSEN